MDRAAAAFLSLSPHGDLSPSPFLHLSFSLRGRGKLHPSDGYTRMAAVSLPTALCIYRYLFTCSRRNNAIPIPSDKCSTIRIKLNEDEWKLLQTDLKELKSRRYLHQMAKVMAIILHFNDLFLRDTKTIVIGTTKVEETSLISIIFII